MAGGADGGGTPGWAAWQLADAGFHASAPLLRAGGAAARVVPLLLSLVPMLYVPPPSADDACVEAAAGLWYAYLERLVEVLRFHGLLPDARKDVPPPAAWAELGAHELPMVLLLLATAAATPRALLKRAAPPGLAPFLAAVAADPYFAVCHEEAHTAAVAALTALDGPAAEAAAGAANAERAATALNALVRAESGRGAGALPAVLLGERVEQLRRCAAALPYLALGDAKDGSVGAAYFSVLVRVARASGEARHVAAVEPLLCAALCHPSTAAREALLSQILATLWADSPQPFASRAPGSMMADSADEAAAFEAIEAAAEATAEAAAAEAAAMTAHLLQPRTLQLLILSALQLAPAGGVISPRLEQLTPSVVSALVARLSPAEMCAFAPHVPLLQARATVASVAAEEVGDAVAAAAAVEAGTHARSLLLAIMPRLPTTVRLAAQLRLLMHRSAAVASRAAHEMGANPPDAPLHALPPESAADAAVRHARPELAAAVRRAHFDGSELRKLLAVLSSDGLGARIRTAAAEQLAVLCSDAMMLVGALKANLLPSLMTALETATAAAEDEDDGEEGADDDSDATSIEGGALKGEAADHQAAALLTLLAIVLASSTAARQLLLRSERALILMHRLAFHRALPVRAKLRDALASLLFEPAALLRAAAAAPADDDDEADAAAPSEPLAPPTPSVTSAKAIALAFFATYNDCGLMGAADAAAADDGAPPPPSAMVVGELRCRAALRAALALAVKDFAPGADDDSDDLAAEEAAASAMLFGTGDGEAEAAAEAEAARGVARAARLQPPSAMAEALVAMEGCRDHASFESCTRHLHSACASHEALVALDPAAAPAPHPLLSIFGRAPCAALRRLLLIAPASPDDDALLALVLELFERALRHDLPPTTLAAADDADADGDALADALARDGGGSNAGGDALTDELLELLTGSGAVVLDRSADGGAPTATGGTAAPSRLPRLALRKGFLMFADALIAARPSAGARLVGGGSNFVELLATQYCTPSASGVPTGLRRLAVQVVAACAARAAPPPLVAAAGRRAAALVYSIVPAAATLRDGATQHGVAAHTLALLACRGLVLRAAAASDADGAAAAAAVCDRGVRWLTRLASADVDAADAAAGTGGGAGPGGGGGAALATAALELTAVVAAVAPPALRSELLRASLPGAARRALDTSSTYAPRAAALRLLLAAAAPAPAAEDDDGDAHPGPTATAVWSELGRVGGARALPALLADGKAPPRVLRRAALLLEALIDAMPPEYAVEMASLLDGPWLNAAMRALSASRHWAVYVGAQPAADGGYEAAAAAAAFSEGQAVEWLRGELPEVHRARAALLRLLRKVAAAEEAAAAAAAEYYGDEAAVAGGLVSRLSGGAPLKELVRVLCADFGPTGVRLDADGAAAADAADGGGPARAAAAAREAVERREAAQAGAALRALLARPSLAAAAAAAEGAWCAAAHEGVRLLCALLGPSPSLRNTLLTCQLEEGAAPWALTIARCFRPSAPMALRLESCRLICVLLEGADAATCASLDAAPAAGGGGGDDGSDDGDGGGLAAGAALASRLLALYANLAAGQPERLGLAVAALRSLLAVSHASKLRVLASGFLPTLSRASKTSVRSARCRGPPTAAASARTLLRRRSNGRSCCRRSSARSRCCRTCSRTAKRRSSRVCRSSCRCSSCGCGRSARAATRPGAPKTRAG